MSLDYNVNLVELKAWQCPCAQNELHEDMVFQGWSGRSWEILTSSQPSTFGIFRYSFGTQRNLQARAPNSSTFNINHVTINILPSIRYHRNITIVMLPLIRYHQNVTIETLPSMRYHRNITVNTLPSKRYHRYVTIETLPMLRYIDTLPSNR